MMVEARISQAHTPCRPAGTQTKTEGHKKVFICSPFRPTGESEKEKQESLKQNIETAKFACGYAVEQGYIPFAPHLYFPQFLDDEDPKEREAGIRFGLEWLKDCDELWIIGMKITEGMQHEIAFAMKHDIPVTQRILSGKETDAGDMFGVLLSAFFGKMFTDLMDSLDDGKNAGKSIEE